jgi:hypothetical protein
VRGNLPGLLTNHWTRCLATTDQIVSCTLQKDADLGAKLEVAWAFISHERA